MDGTTSRATSKPGTSATGAPARHAEPRHPCRQPGNCRLHPAQTERPDADGRARQRENEEGQDVSDEDVLVHRQRAP